MRLYSNYILKKGLTIFLFFCLQPINAQNIIGRIKNGSGGSSINFLYSLGLASKEDSASVTAKGNFTKTFKFNEAKYLLIRYKNLQKEIYIFPEAKFEIEFDATDKTTFKNSFIIKGDYNINRYLDSITTNAVHYKYIYNKVNISHPIDSFRQVLKDFRIFSVSLRQAFFPDIHQNKQIKPLNNFLTTDSINWYSYSVLNAIDYLTIIKTGNKKLFRQEEIKKGLLYESVETYLISDYYRRLWFFFLKGEFEAELKGSDSTEVGKKGFTNFALEYISSKNIHGKLKELIISQLLNDLLNGYTYGSTEEVKHKDILISNLKRMVADKAFLKEFGQRYSDNKKVLSTHRIGKKAPDFILTDSTGRSYALNDFEGKIVLIDVWASWCGPCIKEFPYLHDLEKKLKGDKNFKLLSVSTDATKEIWVKNGLLKFSPPGLGLWVGKEKKFSRDYNIDAIPVLALLDKKGILSILTHHVQVKEISYID